MMQQPMQTQTATAPPPSFPSPFVSAEPGPAGGTATPSAADAPALASPPHRHRRHHRHSLLRFLPTSLAALLYTLALTALTIYECVVGFPLAQQWRDIADAAPAGSLASTAEDEGHALWWLCLASAVALLVFLLLALFARLALMGLAPGSGGEHESDDDDDEAAAPRGPSVGEAPAARASPQLPRRATTTEEEERIRLRRLRRRALLLAAAWLPAAALALCDWCKLAVLASANNKLRGASAGGALDCAAGPSPQDETRAAFHPESAAGTGSSTPICDRFRMAVLLSVIGVAMTTLALLWRATPRRWLSRLVLAPVLSVVAAALLLAKPVTSLGLFAYTQREAFARRGAGGPAGGGGGGGSNGMPPWPAELVLALISLLLASAGAAYALAAALALGAPRALCMLFEPRRRGTSVHRGLTGRGDKWIEQQQQQQQQQQEQQGVAAPSSPELAAAPPAGAYMAAPGTEPEAAASTPTGSAEPSRPSLLALLALLLLAMQLPAAFGLLAPVVALASWGDPLRQNFWIILDLIFGIVGVALLVLVVLGAAAAGAAVVRRLGGKLAPAASGRGRRQAAEEEQEGV
jgi:hypothetical protein